jgi:hypothetical protein
MTLSGHYALNAFVASEVRDFYDRGEESAVETGVEEGICLSVAG